MDENVKLFLKNKIFLILCAMSLLYTFPVFNKYWAPFDEGIILVASQRLLAGELPYKDFFIIMYPPGQIYVLGFLLKIFSYSIIAGRVYTVLVSVGISLLVFYMAFWLTRKYIISLFSWFIVLISLAPRLGAIPAPIWPGVFLSLLALYIYLLYLEKRRYLYILAVGVIAGLAVLFRHDIGIFAILAIFGSFFVKALYDKKTIRDIVSLLAGALIVILPCAVYFITKSATRDIIKSLILFPFIHKATARLPFPAPCFNPNMIFHGSLNFITINQYYIPLLAYFFVFIYLLNQLFKKELYKKENIALIALLLFGILTFNQVMIRTDPAHLLTVIQPAAIILAFLAHKALSHRFNLKINVMSLYTASALLLSLFALLSVKNIDKYIKNTFRKPYQKEVIKMRFAGGSIYVPKEQTEDVRKTLDFIKKNTLSGDRIYIGNIVHWKDDFNGSIILYFLAARLPSTKYYEQTPGLVTNPGVQEEIKNSLVKNNVKLLILQDIDLDSYGDRFRPDTISDGGTCPRRDKFILDDFIRENYKQAEKFGKYNIYVRKEL